MVVVFDRGVGVRALLLAVCVACSGGTSSRNETLLERREPAESHVSTGSEIAEPLEVADLQGAAAAPDEAEIPDEITDLGSRVAPRRLHIPTTRGGKTEHFTFDGHRRGWFARLPTGRQSLLTPVYGDGKVYVGGGFSSHQLFAYDARSGARAWSASAPDGGPSAAIYESGKVLFNTESCTLFAVDAETGRQRWSRWLGDPLMSQPAANSELVFSGHIVDGESPGHIEPGTTGFGVGDGRRYAFTALRLSNGRPRWTRRISADVMNAPVLDAAEGTVLFTTMDGVVWKLDQQTGRVVWRKRLHATSAPWLDGERVHVTVALRQDGERKERAVVLAKADGATEAQYDPVDAPFARRPDTSVEAGWAFEGSRATIVDGRSYQTLGNEIQSRNAETGELLWRRRYASAPPRGRARPASPPAIAAGQLVFGTQDGVLYGLDIDTGMTTWAYDVGEPIVTQPTVAHGWVYAATGRGGLVALEVSDASFDGWHQWGGNAAHNGAVVGATPPVEADERPTEGTLRLDEAARDAEAPVFPLSGTEVTAHVEGFVARVEVRQTFTNPYDRPVEAVYLFPLPDDAAVDGMQLRSGERVIEATIQRREQAREAYESARDRGVLASLLEQERPNLFRQSVANLKPGDSIDVTLRYTQVLPYEEGAYRFVYPLVAGPRFAEEPGHDDPDDADTDVHQVVLAPGEARPDRVSIALHAALGMAVQDVRSPTHAVKVEREGGSGMVVSLDEPARPDRDFEVRFQVAGEAPTVGLATSPPTAAIGESEATPGHFSFAVHPRLEVPDGEVMPRELVFVVDTSSSMHGRPMELAKAAMRRALEGLRPTDTFRVLSFADETEALAEEALPATAANRARGQRFVEGLRALGRTRMVQGIEAALAPATAPDRVRFVVLMTDGYIAHEAEVFRAVHEGLGQSRMFAFGVGSAVNRYLLTRVAEVGRGDVQVVLPGESAEAAADRFHDRIGRPYLTDVQIDWGDLAVENAYPRRLPDLFADRPLVVHAQYRRGGTSEVVIRGRVAGRAFEQRVSITLPDAGEPRDALASIWARTRIRDLMTAMALRPSDGLREEVTQMGLRHHLLTEWTAFIAIDERSRVTTGSTRVDQPSQLPAGLTAPPAPPPSRSGVRRRMMRATSMSSTRGGGVLRALEVRALEAPRPVRAPAATSADSTGAPGTTERARVDSTRGVGNQQQRCMALARRPNGTFDQAAFDACMRRGHKRLDETALKRRRAPLGDGVTHRRAPWRDGVTHRGAPWRDRTHRPRDRE